MSYDSVEQSAYGSRPVELYKFTKGITSFRYSDGDRAVSVGTEFYEIGWPMSRTEPEMSDETTRSSLKVTTSKDHPVAKLFIAGAPGEPVWLSVFRTNAADSTPILIWQGRVKGVSWNNKSQATLECDPVEKVIGKSGFRQTWGPHCNKKLYSDRCKAVEADHASMIVIDSISTTGFVLTGSGFALKPNQYYRMGEISFTDLAARALIVDHTGSSITLKTPILGLLAGMSGMAAAGCDHIYKKPDGSWGNCKERFDNLANFGGWPFTPTKNPYSVSIEG